MKFLGEYNNSKPYNLPENTIGGEWGMQGKQGGFRKGQPPHTSGEQCCPRIGSNPFWPSLDQAELILKQIYIIYKEAANTQLHCWNSSRSS